MPTPLIPQEVFLLERYSSPEYFDLVRDQWEAMVRHVEQCLEVFMSRLPADYRQREISDQPDIVWGERILPNFRSTLQNLNRAYINLTHGDLRALNAAWGVIGGHRGQAENWSGWMDESHVAATIPNAQEVYHQLLNAPQESAWNIARTHDRVWSPGALSSNYAEAARGPLAPPDGWPLYRLNPHFRVSEGGKVLKGGVYLPEADMSCAAVLAEGDDWLDCKVLVGVEEMRTPEGIKYGENPVTEWRATGWTLIERVPGENIPFEQGLGPIEWRPQRVPAGQPCPRA